MDSRGLRSDLAAIVGPGGLVGPEEATDRYERGYRYGKGRALAIVRPGTTAEVADIVRYCFRNDVRLISQGANTGLVAASTPDAAGDQLVVSLERLRGVEAIDANNRSALALAGTRLSELNRETARHDLSLPIDLGADPSVGGMIATNTGGSRLLRYGDVQRNLLGLEAVLADAEGTVLTDLKGLRKDNSGIDLKQLFVGTGGSFGIITRAQVELHRLPRQSAAALIVPSSHADIPELLTILEAQAGEFLSAFEGMSANAMRAALAHNPRLRNPFAPDDPPQYVVLVELSSALATERVNLAEHLTQILGHLMETGHPAVVDARFGPPEQLWAIRHSISDGLKAGAKVIGFDICVARSRLPQLRTRLLELLAADYPFLRVCDFGHCGDGGDHFNLAWPDEAARQYDTEMVTAVRERVYDTVVNQFGGSFSAEHGVGPYNLDYYRRYTPRSERHVASRLKDICDPKRLLGAIDFS